MRFIKINNFGQANIWEILILTTFVSVMFLTGLFVWHEIEIAKLSQGLNQPVNQVINQEEFPVSEEEQADPRYCASDNDCVAASNKNNNCYKDFFNKKATADIKAYEDSMAGIVLPGCPQYGEPVCRDNRCTYNDSVAN